MAAPKVLKPGTAICTYVVSQFPQLTPGQRDRGSTLNRHQVDRRVFPSSIDLNIKFQTVTFCKVTHTGTFNRRDMHECIRLAIITRDEAEALHCVEELDRTSSLVTGQLALRCFGFLFYGDNVTNNHKVACRDLAAAIHQSEFKALTFSKAFQPGALNRTDVYEHVFAAVFTADEAEALLAVEELDQTLALSNDLSRHAATITAAATSTAAWGTEATTAAAARGTKAAAAATIAAAEAAAITAAKSATVAATTAKTIAAAATASKRIKTVLAETVTLVAPTAATSSIKTHKPERTFASPQLTWPGHADESRRATQKMADLC